jgi:acetylornithine deacetylase
VREPFEVDPSADIVRTVRAAAARTLGAEPEIVGHSAWMDAAFLSAAGMPTVVFGPTGEGAHAIEEHVELESVEQVAEIVIETARRFCA